MKSAQVNGLLVGGVAKAKTGKGKEVQLSWLDKPGKPAQSWSFPLTQAGKLTSASLQTLGSDVGNLASGGSNTGARRRRCGCRRWRGHARHHPPDHGSGLEQLRRRRGRRRGSAGRYPGASRCRSR